MKTFLYWSMALVATVWVLALVGTSARAAGQEHEMKVGKKGHMMFTTERKIGDVTLAPGHYQFQHRAEGPDHFVQFTLLKGMMNHPNNPGAATSSARAGQIKCRVDSVDRKVRQTAVYSQNENGAQRITRILVAGENVAHVF